MAHQVSYDYAIIRVVPRVEREEFVNAGVIVSCPTRNFLGARIEMDERKLLTLDESIDLESLAAHLNVIPVICAGGEDAGEIGRLSQRERFHWLVSPRSTIIQMSPVHTGQCSDPIETLEHLFNSMVRSPES